MPETLIDPALLDGVRGREGCGTHVLQTLKSTKRRKTRHGNKNSVLTFPGNFQTKRTVFHGVQFRSLTFCENQRHLLNSNTTQKIVLALFIPSYQNAHDVQVFSFIFCFRNFFS